MDSKGGRGRSASRPEKPFDKNRGASAGKKEFGAKSGGFDKSRSGDGSKGASPHKGFRGTSPHRKPADGSKPAASGGPSAGFKRRRPDDKAASGNGDKKTGDRKPGFFKKFDNKKPRPGKKITKEDAKRLQVERRQTRPHGELIESILKEWNELRERKTPKERKVKLVADILSKLKTRIKEVVLRHDASRVVQGCLKHGNQAQRDAFCKELYGTVLSLTKAKHGHQLIEKMLRYGNAATRTQVHKELKGHMLRLITHNIGALVIETGFNRAWSTEQTWELYQELYGNEFINFKAEVTKRTLDAVLEKYPGKKKSILESIFYTLSKQVDKGLASLSVAQRLMSEYLTHAPAEQIVAMVGQMKDQVLSLMSTREGAKAAALCFAYATPKERKQMFKALKGHVLEVATHSHGHMALIVALHVTDDTRTSNEAVLDELRPHLAYVAGNNYGRKVLLSILTQPTTKYFSVWDMELLKPVTLPAYLVNRKPPAGAGDAPAPAAEGEGAASAPAQHVARAVLPAPPSADIEADESKMVPTRTSKKPDDVRRKELVASIQTELESVLLTHTALLARSRYGSAVVYEAAVVLSKPDVFSAIADLLVEEPTPEQLAVQAREINEAAQLASDTTPATGSKLEQAMAAAGLGAPKAKRARTDADDEAAEPADDRMDGGAAGEEEASEDEDGADEDADEFDEEDDEDNSDDDDDEEDEEVAAPVKPLEAIEEEGASRLPFIEHIPSHLLVKWLLLREERPKPDAVDPASPADAMFGRTLASKLEGSCASYAESNRGAFMLVSLLNSNDSGVRTKVVNELKKDLKALKSLSAAAGLKVLIEAVEAAGKPAATPGKGRSASIDVAAKAAATPTTKPSSAAAKSAAKVAPASSAKAAPTPAAKVAPASSAKAAPTPAAKPTDAHTKAKPAASLPTTTPGRTRSASIDLLAKSAATPASKAVEDKPLPKTAAKPSEPLPTPTLGRTRSSSIDLLAKSAAKPVAGKSASKPKK